MRGGIRNAGIGARRRTPYVGPRHYVTPVRTDAIKLAASLASCDAATASLEPRVDLMSARERRGYGLFKSGAVTKKGDGYLVKGTSGEYFTRGYDCSCADYVHRKETCAHQYAVRFARAAEVETEPKAERPDPFDFTHQGGAR